MGHEKTSQEKFQEKFEKYSEKRWEEFSIMREMHEGEEGNKKIIEEQIEELKNSDEWFEKIKYRAKKIPPDDPLYDIVTSYHILYDVVTPFTDSFGYTLKLQVFWDLEKGNSELKDEYDIMGGKLTSSKIDSHEAKKVLLKYGIYYGIASPDEKTISRSLDFDFDDKKKTREAFRRMLLVALESENEFLERLQEMKHGKRTY